MTLVHAHFDKDLTPRALGRNSLICAYSIFHVKDGVNGHSKTTLFHQLYEIDVVVMGWRCAERDIPAWYTAEPRWQ